MKRMLALGLVVIGCISLLGCTPNEQNSEVKIDVKNTAIAVPVYPDRVGFEDYDGQRAIRAANEVDEEFYDALDRFAYETTAQFTMSPDENLLYSPISLYYAFALATMGAKGETQEEMLALLGVSDLESLANQCGNSYRLLYTDNEIAQLKIANSLWMDREFNGREVEFKEAYLDEAKENFYASVYAVDFSKPETGELMGAWISEQTKGTLEYTYNPDPEQIMSILNTIYFYDEWTDRFNEDFTKEDEFELANGETVTCDFMNSRYGSHGFVKGEGFTRSSLGLKEAGSMVFILPDEGISVRELLSSSERIQSIFRDGESQSGEVIWQVPKFSYSVNMKLKDIVQALGVQKAFEGDADFTGITDNQAFISEILQKTHIAIDENGVEASAYTEIAYCGACPPEGRAEMILDRPFIFGIQSRYGDLLFIGVCNNPTL